MRSEAAITVATAFVDAINRRSSEDLAALMTEDHVLIDSLGSQISGRERVKAGWRGYFRMVPDYMLTVNEVFCDESAVVMLGTAQGTYSRDGCLKPENHWTTPAAWRATIRDGLVAEWRVYADNEPIRRVMARKD